MTTEREFTNRNNPYKTHWVTGELVELDGREYQIADIQKVDRTYFRIQLVRKYEESRYIRVPR